ncbi:hypothetical protein K474DRAFT_1729844 [Panus rudis PR-1116 ss-1]|nr:hypothetical protein K474DRAFT_1729844 [Panus rudis PR-1116 ss-1]
MNANHARDQIHKTLQSNKDHQYALKVHTERLEAELQSVEKLLVVFQSISELPDDDVDVDAGGSIVVPDSVRASTPIPLEVSGESPFQADSERRHRYLRCVAVHPMRSSELDSLTEAVRAENYRLHALEMQQKGQHPFGAPPEHYENTRGINWERVALKVSAGASTAFQRTARECEIKWLGSHHPRFNHSAWTQTEISRVREIVDGSKDGEVDWNDVAAKLGTNRTPVDCMRHAIIRKAHTWTPESDQRLLDAIEIYGTNNWSQVARAVSEDATANQCQSRYMRVLEPSISRNPWTKEEDALLREAVEVYGNSWMDVAQFIPGRNSEQCRDRWQDRLAPTISKGRWGEEEDRALLAAVAKVGESKWKEISRVLGNGRTDNMCRSRYNVLMKRKPKEAVTVTSASASATPAPTEQPTAAGESAAYTTELTFTPPYHPVQAAPVADVPPNAEPSTTVNQLSKPRPRPRCKQTTAATSPAATSQGDTTPPPTNESQGQPSPKRRKTQPRKEASEDRKSEEIGAGQEARPTSGAD